MAEKKSNKLKDFEIKLLKMVEIPLNMNYHDVSEIPRTYGTSCGGFLSMVVAWGSRVASKSLDPPIGTTEDISAKLEDEPLSHCPWHHGMVYHGIPIFPTLKIPTHTYIFGG